MNNNFQQKNIINPYFRTTLASSGIEYNLDDERNQLILEGIQDCYLNYGFLPEVGYQLSSVGPINDQNNIITDRDLRVYLMIYPQNGLFVGADNRIKPLSQEDRLGVLYSDIIEPLLETNKISFYLSPTSPAAQLPENQAPVDKKIEDLSEEEVKRFYLSQLISIPYESEKTKISLIRQIFKNNPPVTDRGLGTKETLQDPATLGIQTVGENYDLEDWKNNAPPGSFSPVVYYNYNDGFYYYVKRTNNRDAFAYDVGKLEQSQNNLNEATLSGVSAILKITSTYSLETATLLLDNSQVEIETYISQRPDSRWLYLIKIPQSLINSLERQENIISERKYLAPYQKAELIISPENTVTSHCIYTEEYLNKLLPELTSVLSIYDGILLANNIRRGTIQGLDLSRVNIQIDNFLNNLIQFKKYNQIKSLYESEYRETDNISYDFALDDDMRIIYITFNGMVFTQGLGITFLSQIDPEVNNNLMLSIINCFIDQTTTSVGYIFSGNSILKDTSIPQDDWQSWQEFLQKYTLPRLSISPELVQKTKDNNSFLIPPGGNIFTKLSELQSSTPVNPRENWSFSDKDYENIGGAALKNCNSGIASRIKDGQLIYNVIQGNVKVSALVNKAAYYLRQELVKKEVDKAILKETENLPGGRLQLGDVENLARNPSAIKKEIEVRIQRELDCLLGRVGATIQKEILNPMDNPPGLKALTNTALNHKFSIDYLKISKTMQPKRPDPYGPWLELLNTLLSRFVMQIFASVLKDILEALMGCGPTSEDDETPQRSPSFNLYGILNINDYLGDIDIEEIAVNSGLSNKIVEFGTEPIIINGEDSGEVNEVAIIVKSRPQQKQLEQFHNDVSAITTPSEIRSLLRGNGGISLIKEISQMVNNGEIDTQQLEDQYSRPQRQNKIVQSIFQESLESGDERYAVLGFDETTLVDYFRNLSRALSADEIAAASLEPITPEEAYCGPENPLSEYGNILSDEQVEMILDSEINSVRQRLNELCNTDPFDLGWEIKIKEFLDKLGYPDWYEDFLAAISDFMKWLEEYVSNIFTDATDSGGFPNVPSIVRTFPSFVNSQLGSSICYVGSRNPSIKQSSLVWPDPIYRFRSLNTANGSYSSQHLRIVLFSVDSSWKGKTVQPTPAYENIGDKLERVTRRDRIKSARDTRFGLLSAATVQYARTQANQPGFPNPNNARLPVYRSPIEVVGDIKSIARNDQDQYVDAEFTPTSQFFQMWFGENNLEIRAWWDWYKSTSIIRGPNRDDLVSSKNSKGYSLGNYGWQPSVLKPTTEIPLGGDNFRNSLYGTVTTLGTNYDLDIRDGFVLGQEEAKKELGVSQNMLTSAITLPETENPNAPVEMQVDLRNTRTSTGDPSSDLIRGIEPVIRELISQGRGMGIDEEQINFEDPGRYIPSLRLPENSIILSSTLTTANFSGFLSQNYKDVPEISYEAFFSENGRATFPGVSNAIFSPKFEETGEKCVNPSLTRAMMGLLSNYQNEFLVNVIPLLDTYVGINMPSTMLIIEDYLYRKIHFQLMRGGILNTYEEEIDSLIDFYNFQRTMVNRQGIEENIESLDPLTATFEQKLKEIIHQYLIRSLEKMPEARRESLNIGAASPDLQYTSNFLEDPTAIRTYCVWFAQQFLGDMLFPGDNLSLTQRRILATIRSNYLGNTRDPIATGHILKLASYYAPISVLYGLYYTSYDFYIPVSEEYHFYRKIIQTPRNQLITNIKTLKNPLVTSQILDVSLIQRTVTGDADYSIPGSGIFDEV